MTVFIDANVLLDVMLRREPFVEDARKVMALCATSQADGWISSLTLCNIAYILRKRMPPLKLRSVLRDIRRCFCSVDLTEEVMERAVSGGSLDFEDAVQIACAQSCQADYIVTRDKEHFQDSPVPALSPAEFFALPIELFNGIWEDA